MKRRFLSACTVLAMLLTLLPTAALAVGPGSADYILRLNSGSAYKGNSPQIDTTTLKNMGISYDQDKGEWVFENVDFTTTKPMAIKCESACTIRLVGENKVSTTYQAGNAYGVNTTSPDSPLTFTGTGSLTVTTADLNTGNYGNYGIQALGGLTIDGGAQINVNCGNSGSASYAAVAVFPGSSELIIRKGTLTAQTKGTYALSKEPTYQGHVAEIKAGANSGDSVVKNVSDQIAGYAIKYKYVSIVVDHADHAVSTDCGYTNSVSWEAWDGISSLENEGNYYLTQSASAGTVNINANVKLCLNGKTLTCNLTVADGKTLTICDCGTEGTVKNSGARTVCLQGESTLNLYGGTIKNTSSSCYAVEIVAGGFVNVYSGTIESNYCGILNSGTGTVNVCGGSVTGNSTSGSGYGIADNPTYNATASGTYTISGGKISATASSENTFGVAIFSRGEVTISGGELIGNNNNGRGTGVEGKGNTVTVAVSGGTVTGQGVSGYGIFNPNGTSVTVIGGSVKGQKADETVGMADIYIGNSKSDRDPTEAIIHLSDGTKNYSGDPLRVKLYDNVLKANYYVAQNVSDANKNKITIVNEDWNTEYDAMKSALKLVKAHTHTWDTDWTTNSTHH